MTSDRGKDKRVFDGREWGGEWHDPEALYLSREQATNPYIFAEVFSLQGLVVTGSISLAQPCTLQLGGPFWPLQN